MVKHSNPYHNLNSVKFEPNMQSTLHVDCSLKEGNLYNLLNKPFLPWVIVLFAHLLIHLINIYHGLAYYTLGIVLRPEEKENEKDRQIKHYD